MKAVFNNLKLAVFVYLLVLLLNTLVFVYVPKGLETKVEGLQQLIQSKQLLVNSFRSRPPKKPFVIPKEAPDWLKQLPPNPEVDRSLIQLNDLMNQMGVQFESISMQDQTSSLNGNEIQQLLNNVIGKNAQNQTQKQQTQAQNTNQGNQKSGNDKNSQTVKTVTFNLTISGKYDSVMDLLYQLVHTERLFHIDSLQLTQQAATATTTPLQLPTQQNSAQQNSIQQQVPNQANSQTQNQSQQQQAQTLQSFLANGITNPNQGQAAAQNSVLPNTQSTQPVAIPPADNVSVTMTLSAYYMPDASFLGNLPVIQTYPPEKRNNPFVP